MTTSKKISRRTVLRGLGTALALPWLEAMTTSAPLIANVTKRTAITKPPVRMAFVYVPNGMHMPDWKPQGPGGKDFELQAIMKPIEEFREKMNVFSGLSLRNAQALGDGGGDHARSVASFLTGAHPKKTHGKDIRNGVSVDQIAAEKIGHLTKLKSLELGTEGSSTGGRCDSGYSCLYTSNVSWRNETSPISKEINPAGVFERLFGSENDVENMLSLAKRDAKRKSILDFVHGEAKSLSHQLGAADRRKLDEYLYAVRDIERRLHATEKLTKDDEDFSNFPRPIGVPREFGEHVKLLFDMMVLAFQTDSTRVCSLMYANAGSNRSYRNLAIREGHHSISHHGKSLEKQQKISKINVYHMSLAKHLLQRMDSIKEGNGTLLDNSMILYGSGIADGNSHAHNDLPIALFGGGGGTIKTGRYIRKRVGTPLTNLHRSMLERVGAEVETFSDSTGTIEELHG
ncbi:MAG: DUF1552 domain-containing protein [Mariniblastus sp.]|nr:DUF1552 domain-containing protein [Mariniblastus sp.]